jgi:murein DD-endopeptidase MepM/ murein hydrolase activator NlpD
MEQGKRVMAGELLGYMGNTGYGVEGTTGNFDVHLHVGIYIKTQNYSELSINPYWILKYLEDKKLSYTY